MRLYSNEIVFRGHPDKVCDQISDALVDEYIKGDKNSRCAIEVMGGKGKIFITGEVTSKAKVDVESVVRKVLNDVLYEGDYEIVNNLGMQSPDIALGVDTGGAGDQGMMFGYACRGNEHELPTAMVILQELSKEYDKLCHKDNRFKSDGKAQITGYYENNRLVKIKFFTVSYQNVETDRENTDKIIKRICNKICKKYDIKVEKYLINPTGKFEIGGFMADAGLTGRKIVVDSYQSFARVGGGAFSGKDPSKVDRSAAYMARKIAKEYLYHYRYMNPYEVEVQISYAIGLEEPLSINIKVDGKYVNVNPILYKRCTPRNIIKELDLLNTCFYDKAKFGHFE